MTNHFEEAEDLLTALDGDMPQDVWDRYVAEAQVHATLAQAAMLEQVHEDLHKIYMWQSAASM